MKVTSLKDLEAYIYSGVILPLKELVIDMPGQSSPMSDPGGGSYMLSVSRNVPNREFQHNYQRREAEANATWLVILNGPEGGEILAEYQKQGHTVRIYRGAFNLNSKILQNKLEEAFRNHTPFTGVTLVSGRHIEAVPRRVLTFSDRIEYPESDRIEDPEGDEEAIVF